METSLKDHSLSVGVEYSLSRKVRPRWLLECMADSIQGNPQPSGRNVITVVTSSKTSGCVMDLEITQIKPTIEIRESGNCLLKLNNTFVIVS